MKANIPDASYAVYRALALAEYALDEEGGVAEQIDEPTEDNDYVSSFVFRDQKYEVRLTAVPGD